MARNPAAKPNPARIAAEQATVFALKLKGKSVRAIAAETGIPRSTVQDRLDAAYAELVSPLAEQSKVIELERLNSWQVKLEESLDRGEDPIRVVPVLIQVSTRRAKIEGYEAAQKVEQAVTDVTPPVRVAALVRQAQADSEADEAAVRGSTP